MGQTNHTRKDVQSESLTSVCSMQATEGSGWSVNVQQSSHFEQQQEERQSHALWVQQQQTNSQQATKQQQRGRVDSSQSVGLHSGPAVHLSAPAQLSVIQGATHALVDLGDEVVQLGLGADAGARSVAGRGQGRTSGCGCGPGLHEHSEGVEPDQEQPQSQEKEGGPGEGQLRQADQLSQIPEAVLWSGTNSPVEPQAHRQQW